MDLATLGLAVDSKPVKVANDDLKDFSRSAEGAEKAADGYSRGASKATTATGKLQQSVDAAEASISKMKVGLLAVGAAIGTAFGVGISSAVKRLEDARAAAARVDKALANSGTMAGKSAADIEAWADMLERRTGRAAEEVMAVAANLASFSFGEQTFFRAIELADDMSAAWGGDLKQNLEGLARALDDPIKGFAMLRQRGISLTDAQAALVKSFMDAGDAAGAQNVVFRALEAQVKGVAEAGFGGLTAAMANAKLAVEQFFEGIVLSTGLMTGLQFSLYAVAYAFDAITAHMDVLVGVTATLASGLAVVFGPSVLSMVIAIAGAIGTTLVSAFWALTAAIAANPIGALITGFTMAITAAYMFRDEIQQAIGIDVVGIVKNAANMVIGSFVAAFEDIKFVWNQFPNIIGASVIGAVNATISGIASMIQKAASQIDAFSAKANEWLPENMQIGLIGNIAGKGGGTIENPYADALEKAVGDRNASVNAAMSRDYIGELGAMFQTSTPAAQNFGAAIKGVNDNLAELGGGGGAGAGGKASTKATDPWAGLRTATEQVTQTMSYAGEAAKGFLSDLANGLKNGEGLFESFANAAINSLQKIADKLIESGINSMFGNGSGGGGILSSLFGGLVGGGGQMGIATGGGIGLFANGGVSNRPAIFGEAGPEAAVPLPDGRHIPVRMMGGSNDNGGGGVQADVRVFFDENGNLDAKIERISQKNVKAGIQSYDKGSAVRTAGNLRQVNVRGYTK